MGSADTPAATRIQIDLTDFRLVAVRLIVGALSKSRSAGSDQ
jgi:hypothetical protein